MIWFALLIPVLVSIVLYVFFPKYAVWWEFIIPFAASIITIGILHIAIKQIGVWDTEYIGYLTKQAIYYEPWDEYIHQTCTKTVSCGKNCTTTQSYDCSYVKNHPPSWKVFTATTNTEIYIDRSQYNYIVKRFNKVPQFKNMRRDYHRQDGDAYYVTWDNKRSTAVPITTTQLYKNKVRASKDVFNYPELDTLDINMYYIQDYPELNSILNNTPILPDSLATEAQQQSLRFYNGKLGPSKQARIWILLNPYPTRQAGLMQEAYWVNGNKNEIVLVIGTNDKEIRWAHVFSWTEKEALKIQLRNYVESQDSLNFSTLIPHVASLVEKDFVRKNFSDFDYLSVEPPLWAILLAYFITILVNAGTIIYIVKNEHYEPRHRHY